MTDSPPTPPVPRPPLTQAFRHRNYRLFFFGQMLSQMGSWMQIIGQSWLVYRLTGSPLALGLIGFLAQSPVFFLAVFGGTVADRVDRRRLIIFTQAAFLLQAAALATLSFTGVVEVWHVALLALFYGLMNAIDIPTRQSFTAEMVGREDLQSAIALNSIMFNSARIVGPAVAGVTIAAIGESWCFAINAVSYVAVLISLLMMRLTRFVKPAERPRALSDLLEGFRYVIGNREIRTALLALAVSSFAGGPYLTLMPVFANEVLKVDAGGYGLLMTTVGAGALCGALAMSRLNSEILRRAPSVAAIGFGLCMTAFSFSRDYALAVTLILPTAFCLMLQGSSTNIIVQLNVEDRMRGRVMAYYTMSFLGMMPFGALAAGATAHAIGVPLTLTCGGLLCAIGGVVALWLRYRRSV
ncbi:Enterobactin exporter EntS [Alphaproteobacteria bacterium SO-S41]|nr:Enterobactin exporter EntS [Alphaproteobacteria bacterium SO-S41]